MKKLFRDRKPSIDSKAKPAIQGHATLASTEPPLYARFSSVQRGQDNGGPTKPIVSGPMQLSSRPSLSKGSSSAAAPVLASKSKEAEKETKDMGRMPSRTSQDTQKPQIMKGSKMPNRMSQEGIRSQMLNGLSSRTTRAEERQQVVTSLPPRRSSRPLPTAPIYDDPHIAFPRMQSLEYNRSGPPSEALVAPRLDWAPTGSSSSLASDSVSYSPPLRQLVVRNFDPENDSLADSIVRPAHTTVHSPPQHVLSPRVEPGTLGVSSPLSQPAPLRPSGFDTKDQPRSPPAPSDFRDPTPLRTAPIPVNDHVPRNFDHPPALSNSLSSVPHSQPESHSVLHPSKPPPSRPQDTHRDDSVHVPTAELPVRKVSLLSTPSITRKKYSPLAAFGLSVSDANPTSNPTASTSSASIPDDKVSKVCPFFILTLDIGR
ncbi:hypothetical protein BC835DRAFT_444156 [Cytidiella melzeri]|nr:hypothetical protein BC835DRAFT_444156 [Cytidiella melzeri]